MKNEKRLLQISHLQQRSVQYQGKKSDNLKIQA